MKDRIDIRPARIMEGVFEYATPKHPAPIDLHLDKNEGASPPEDLVMELVAAGAEKLRRYASASSLEGTIAGMMGIEKDRVLVTAGGDDAIGRALRTVLEPGREIIVPVPTFEMIGTYAALAGGTVIEVPWCSGAYPIEAVTGLVRENTAAIAVVTPNNPTGLVATGDDLKKLSQAAPQALLLVDLAYVEFADEDLTDVALSLPNAVVIRTLSKVWGLAGLRVGWAAGPATFISWMRAAGNPYAVSSASLALAEARLSLEEGVDGYVRVVRDEVREISAWLVRLGIDVLPSQANFVLARVPNAAWFCDALAGLGIAVRMFPESVALANYVRITMPGDAALFARLQAAICAVLAPEALLFDIDDTLADVTESYRKATVATAEVFGVCISYDDITRAKAAGNANNDWELTWRLIRDSGVRADLDEVTQKFEAFYQGADGVKGFKLTEKLLMSRNALTALAVRFKLGVVTGRPRCDAQEFLKREGLADLFGAVITMDDGPLKPSPEPVRMALSVLGVEHAWLFGDTPDDMRAARGAGVVPIGVIAPADDPVLAREALSRAGAARVLMNLDAIEEVLP
jgi:histidinol-phosphate aminotransferase